MTRRRRCLVICHNHPGTRPGGAEGYAYEMFRAFDDRPDYDATFLAKGGPPLGRSGQVHVGTPIAPIDGATNEYHLFTDGYTYDWFRGSITDPDFAAVHVRKFLEALRPDVVHIQHLQFLGYDLIRTIRAVVPDAVIVYTLHEYGAICHQQGQMVRSQTNELCDSASPRRCHECFPEHTPQDFFLRQRHLQSHLSLVDRFISPSSFLRDRYISWGIPADRIIVEPNGRTWPEPPQAEREEPTRSARNRFGFFGQLNPFKGLDVLLEAMVVLTTSTPDAPAENEPELFVHGANLDLQSSEYQSRIEDLLDAAGSSVTMVGPYRPRDLGELMRRVDWVVIPSIWWENAPLVIQEAFHHGRPIICSDIGGMAEQVSDDLDGLHAHVGDPASFARVLRRAASEPGLWERLHGGIRAPHDMTSHVERLHRLYDELADRPSATRTLDETSAAPPVRRSRQAVTASES